MSQNKYAHKFSTNNTIELNAEVNATEVKEVVKTEADKLWDRIKGLKIEMFALPNQTISQYCTFRQVEPSKLYITMSCTSVLPALEVALGPNFTIGYVGKYITIEPSKS